MDKINISNRQIEQMAIAYVKQYLKGENIEPGRNGADIICNGKFIDVKGCLKKETNIRMTQQALEGIAEQGKLRQGSFYIYFVYDILSEPKLLIIDYNTFKKNKMPEIKWIIQPNKIKNKQEAINLTKIDF